MPRTIWSGTISFGPDTSLNQSHPEGAGARRTTAELLNAREALRKAGQCGPRPAERPTAAVTPLERCRQTPPSASHSAVPRTSLPRVP